jgi:hypothetical protein
MATFDTTNWKRYKWAYLTIMIVIVLVLIFIIRGVDLESKGSGILPKKDGNGNSHCMGRGHSDDSVEELLDRIEWSSYLDRRIGFWKRIFPATIIATGIIMLVGYRSIPKPGIIIATAVAMFIPFYMARQLYYVHSDVYNDYYIKNNVKLLRAKLHLHKGNVREPRSEMPPTRTVVMDY